MLQAMGRLFRNVRPMGVHESLAFTMPLMILHVVSAIGCAAFLYGWKAATAVAILEVGVVGAFAYRMLGLSGASATASVRGRH